MNMHTALYFPTPYPGELLYSLFARFQSHMGYRNTYTALKALFGQGRTVISYDFQGGLSRLGWLFEGRWQISLADAANRFTLLPYYLSTLESEQRAELAGMLEGGDASALAIRLGLPGIHVRPPEFLRMCPVCIEEDLARFGETYWRRSHQLPGVLMCPTHSTELRNSDVRIRQGNRNELVAANKRRMQASVAVPFLEGGSRERLADIARRSDEVLKAGCVSSKSCGVRLEELNLTGRRKDQLNFETEFVNHHGQPLLKLLGCDLEPGDTNNWLHIHCHGRRRYIHPLRHILVDAFLDAEGTSIARPSFGPGPWPCLNWQADHFQQRVVEKMEYIRDFGGKNRTLARFSCICGFVFTREAGDGGLPNRPHRVVSYGPVFEELALAMRQSGKSLRGIGRALGVDHGTVTRTLERATGLRDRGWPGLEERKKADRNEWLSLVGSHPEWSITKLITHARNLYARLIHNDQAWLDSINRELRQKPQAPAPRIDWKERDEELAKDARVLAARLRERLPPKRVTHTAVLRELGNGDFFSEKRHLLPRLQATLDEVCESESAFRERRLCSLLTRVRAGEVTLQPWRVRRLVSVCQALPCTSKDDKNVR